MPAKADLLTNPNGVDSPGLTGFSDETKPVFDMANLSWRELKSLTRLQADVTQAQQMSDPDAIETALTKLEMMFAKVIVSLPRSWLVPSAPQALDWSDPETIGYMRGDHFQMLLKAFNAAQDFETLAGNSAAR